MKNTGEGGKIIDRKVLHEFLSVYRVARIFSSMNSSNNSSRISISMKDSLSPFFFFFRYFNLNMESRKTRRVGNKDCSVIKGVPYRREERKKKKRKGIISYTIKPFDSWPNIFIFPRLGFTSETD